MDQAEIARLYYDQELSLREISKKMNVHRNTVTRYIKLIEEIFADKQLSVSNITDWKGFLEENEELMKYNSTGRIKPKLNTSLEKSILEIIENEEWYSIIDIYNLINKRKIYSANNFEETTVGYSTVYQASKKLNVKRRPKPKRSKHRFDYWM